MATYNVPITAIRYGIVSIAAETEAQAIQKAWEAIREGQFQWYKDFGAEFSVGEPKVPIPQTK